MRWYVNRGGETTGPFEERDVTRWVQEGMVDAYLRDEAGGTWTPVAQSPFAQFIPRSAPAAAVKSETPQPSASRAQKPTSASQFGSTLLTLLGKSLLLIFISILVLGVAATGIAGLVLGIAAVAYGILARKRQLRTPFELYLKKPAKTWGAIATTSLGVLMLLAGIGGLQGQGAAEKRREQATREAKERAAVAEKQHAQQVDKDTREAPARIAEWRDAIRAAAAIADSSGLEAGLQRVKGIQAASTALAGELGARAPAELSLVATEAAAAVAGLQGHVDTIERVSGYRLDLQHGQEMSKTRDWIAADDAYSSALSKLDNLKTLSGSARQFIPDGFDIARERIRAANMRAGIAGAVAQERRRLEKEEQERKKTEAYRAVCGDPPALGGWDGELVGLEYVIKQSAHDPDSIDVENCTQPALTKSSCWVSTCDVRGKNMFGAMILNRKTFTYSKLQGFQEAQ